MRPTRNPTSPMHDPWKSRLHEKAKSSGTQPTERSRRATTEAQPTQRRQSKRSSEEKPQSAEKDMSGSQSFSRRHQQATRSNWTGSSQRTWTPRLRPRSRSNKSSPLHPSCPANTTKPSKPTRHFPHSKAKNSLPRASPSPPHSTT